MSYDIIGQVITLLCCGVVTVVVVHFVGLDRSWRAKVNHLVLSRIKPILGRT